MQINTKTEYPNPIPLTGAASKYIYIPSSLILDTTLNAKRISVFSFLCIRKGLDNILTFSINNIAKYCNCRPDRHKGAFNHQITDIITKLATDEYISLSGKLTSTSHVESVINTDKISHKCSDTSFAILYLDEIAKILNYKSHNIKDTSLNASALLLVFAYLRMMIIRRTNRFKTNECDLSIDERKKRYPDAYSCFYSDISDALGVSEKVVSKSVTVLSQLGLVYFETLPRISSISNSWKNGHTIFCNTYKRERNLLLASGSEYYGTEVNNKKIKMGIISQ